MTNANVTITGKSVFNLNGAQGGVGGNGDPVNGGDGGAGGDAFGGAVGSFTAPIMNAIGKGNNFGFKLTTGVQPAGVPSSSSSPKFNCSSTVTFTANRAIGGAGGQGVALPADDVVPTQLVIWGATAATPTVERWLWLGRPSAARTSWVMPLSAAPVAPVGRRSAAPARETGASAGEAVGGAIWAYGGLIVSAHKFQHQHGPRGDRRQWWGRRDRSRRR